MNGAADMTASLTPDEIAELEQISLKLGDIAKRLLIIGKNNEFPSVAGLLATVTGGSPPSTASAARRSPLDDLAERMMGPRENPLHPMFRDHNCWRCDSGKTRCVVGNPSNCEYPHARND
jgi:hypothetical protein